MYWFLSCFFRHVELLDTSRCKILFRISMTETFSQCLSKQILLAHLCYHTKHYPFSLHENPLTSLTMHLSIPLLFLVYLLLSNYQILSLHSIFLAISSTFRFICFPLPLSNSSLLFFYISAAPSCNLFSTSLNCPLSSLSVAISSA